MFMYTLLYHSFCQFFSVFFALSWQKYFMVRSPSSF